MFPKFFLIFIFIDMYHTAKSGAEVLLNLKGVANKYIPNKSSSVFSNQSPNILNARYTALRDVNFQNHPPKQKQQPHPRCEIPILKNGDVKLRHRGKLIRFSCSKNYMLIGNTYAGCGNNGKWDTELPICARKGCTQRFAEPANGAITYEKSNAIAHLYCKNDFIVAGSHTTYCNGIKWDRPIGWCRPRANASDLNPYLSCDFESEDLCGWQQSDDDDFEWKRTTGIDLFKRVRTGPQHDHTTQKSFDGHYMLVESLNILSPSYARIISPIYTKALSVNSCFQFWYHMYGSTVGNLRIFVKPTSIPQFNEYDDNYQSFLVWEKKHNQGNEWHHAIINLPQFKENFQIIIEGTTGLGHLSDIAVDDVSISTNNQCKVYQSYNTPETKERIHRTTNSNKEVSKKKNTQMTESSTHVLSLTASVAVVDTMSCRNRCNETVSLVLKTDLKYKILLNMNTIMLCDCHEDCQDTNTCCLDYNYICEAETQQLEYKSTTTEIYDEENVNQTEKSSSSSINISTLNTKIIPSTFMGTSFLETGNLATNNYNAVETSTYVQSKLETTSIWVHYLKMENRIKNKISSATTKTKTTANFSNSNNFSPELSFSSFPQYRHKLKYDVTAVFTTESSRLITTRRAYMPTKRQYNVKIVHENEEVISNQWDKTRVLLLEHPLVTRLAEGSGISSVNSTILTTTDLNKGLIKTVSWNETHNNLSRRKSSFNFVVLELFLSYSVILFCIVFIGLCIVQINKRLKLTGFHCVSQSRRQRIMQSDYNSVKYYRNAEDKFNKSTSNIRSLQASKLILPLSKTVTTSAVFKPILIDSVATNIPSLESNQINKLSIEADDIAINAQAPLLFLSSITSSYSDRINHPKPIESIVSFKSTTQKEMTTSLCSGLFKSELSEITHVGENYKANNIFADIFDVASDQHQSLLD